MKTLNDKILNSLSVTTLLKAPIVTQLGEALPLGSLKILDQSGTLRLYYAEQSGWSLFGAGADLEAVLTEGNDAGGTDAEMRNLERIKFNSISNVVIGLGINTFDPEPPTNSVNITFAAPTITQGNNAVAIGNLAGDTNQSDGCVAIGRFAGQVEQEDDAVAIGFNCGQSEQGEGSVAVGADSGAVDQGLNCVAIGFKAGGTNQPDNSIVINADTFALDSAGTGRMVLNHVREVGVVPAGFKPLYYNLSTSELVYDTA